MKPKIIRTEQEYEVALAHLDTLMDAAPGSDAEEELELWSLVVESYEKTAFPMDLPSPLAAIRFRMDQLGLGQKDLAEYLSGKSHASEVLSGKRPLSLKMVRRLHHHLRIPAELLIQEPSAPA